jgi:hypothetical protein
MDFSLSCPSLLVAASYKSFTSDLFKDKLSIRVSEIPDKVGDISSRVEKTKTLIE